MTPELIELNKVIEAVHRKGPSGEHMVGLALDLPSMDRVSGTVWISWKNIKEFEHVPIAEVTAALRKTFDIGD